MGYAAAVVSAPPFPCSLDWGMLSAYWPCVPPTSEDNCIPTQGCLRAIHESGGQSQCVGNLWAFWGPSRLLVCLFKAGSHTLWAGLKLIMKPNMTFELLTLLLKPSQYWGS